jgi:hypothetical protein
VTNARTASKSALLGLAAVLIMAAAGCRSTSPVDVPTTAELEAAQEQLSRPLSADPAALYRLRIPASGGLRLALLTSGSAGRLTVSEPFGAAISITAWQPEGTSYLYDLRAGCRLPGGDLSRALGVGALPLPQAVLLLCGRLPAAAGDDVLRLADGTLRIEGGGWAGAVELARDPWRVRSIRQADGSEPGWTVRLDDHVGSIPGIVRIERSDGRWAELELMTLEWNRNVVLPSLPSLPDCSQGPD